VFYIIQFKNPDDFQKATKTEWRLRAIFSCFLLGTVYRYFDAIRYGFIYRVKCKNAIVDFDSLKKIQYHYYLLMTATGMRLMECLMESAPQLILQLYIFVNEIKTGENLKNFSKNIIYI
jgi:hypothetical protein